MAGGPAPATATPTTTTSAITATTTTRTRRTGRRTIVAAALLVINALIASACGSGTTPVSSLGAGLTGPAGVTASVYATGLANASGFAFDGGGRLWVATASTTDDGNDGVWLVPSAGATPTQIVTGIKSPMGMTWIGDTLYVASMGRVDAFTGFDGSAFADVHQVVALPDGAGQSGGLVVAPDGRLWLGVSAHCDNCTPTTEGAAAVVSFNPDGRDLRVEAKGIRAPVGLAYVPGTSDLLVTMNQLDGLGEATPGDWLAHVQSGQDWAFPACTNAGGPACAGVPSPVAVLDQHAAVSGLAIVAGQLGPTVGTAALVAEWSTGVVKVVDLTHDSTGYHGTVTATIKGITKPVAVIQAKDGSVLVGDWGTGTIYRLAATNAA